MLTMCVLYVSLGSSVTPNIFWCVFMGSVVFYICRCSMVLYSAGSDANSVHVVLSGLIMLSFVQVCNCCRYGCMYALAAFCWSV